MGRALISRALSGGRLAYLWLVLVGGCAAAGATPARVAPLRAAVLLVSIDGFRADYLDRPQARQLRRLANQGVRARWLTPVFPSKTFPNHYSIVTGLYPEHHGIVSNTMLEPVSGRRFRIDDTLAVRDSSWWGGEPIWVTAVKQRLRSATFFWPGSEAAIEGIRPTWWKRFTRSHAARARIDFADRAGGFAVYTSNRSS